MASKQELQRPAPSEYGGVSRITSALAGAIHHAAISQEQCFERGGKVVNWLLIASKFDEFIIMGRLGLSNGV